MSKSLKRSSLSTNDQDTCSGDDVLFWINKTGFPITDSVWNRMFDHASKSNPAGAFDINVIKNTQSLPAVPVPKPPTNLPISLSVAEKLETIQNYMCELQYNHTGTQFFDIKKYKSLNSLAETAKEIIKESLPIKCLEAVVLGIYLTNGISGLERYTLGFRTVFGSNVHRHVVLVVSANGLYGALGMSRREDLMYKPLKFVSLADLVVDYIESYNQYWHKVDKVKIGFPVSHDPHSLEGITWKGLCINPSRMTQEELRAAVDKHTKDIKAWVRQAPIGKVYAPRPQATGYPQPTSSQPSKVKFTSTSSSLSADSPTQAGLEKQSTSKPSNTSQTSPRKQTKTFEMRI